MPKTLTIYVYSMWEGIDDPDLTTLDVLVLNHPFERTLSLLTL